MGLTRAKRVLGSRGFTFVELLLAVGILSIVAVGTAAAMVQGPRLSRVAREEMLVRSAMRGMVAEISAAPYSEIVAAFSGEGFEVPGVHASALDADKLPGAISVDEIREGTVRYFRVTLTVTWHGVQGVRSIRSSHYVSNARGDTADVLSAGTSVQGIETLSTDPNLSYYDGSPYAAPADPGTTTSDDPVLIYLAQLNDGAGTDVATDTTADPVTDPVETIPTSVTPEATTDGTQPQ